MGFQDYKNNLIKVVVVIFTVSQLLLLPTVYIHPEQKTTADFIMYFFPWICALVFSLMYLGGWLWQRVHKKSTSNKNDIKPTGNIDTFANMTPEQTRILFESLTKMKPTQIVATLNSLSKMTMGVKDAETIKEKTEYTKAKRANSKRKSTKVKEEGQASG